MGLVEQLHHDAVDAEEKEEPKGEGGTHVVEGEGKHEHGVAVGEGEGDGGDQEGTAEAIEKARPRARERSGAVFAGAEGEDGGDGDEEDEHSRVEERALDGLLPRVHAERKGHPEVEEALGCEGGLRTRRELGLDVAVLLLRSEGR